MAPKSLTRTIRVIADTSGAQGLKDLAYQMGLLGKQTKALNDTLGKISGVFTTIFSASVFGVGIGQVISMADSMSLLRDRINLFTGDAAVTNKVMEELAARSISSRSSIEDLATTYNRLAQATKNTGIDSTTLLDVTEALQKTFLLSGATSREAAAASVQLSQGLASGTLRGEEFNSVMEQNVEFGNLLEKTLGKNRSQLREMAKEGKITSREVLTALLKNFEDLRIRAAKLNITVDQSSQILKTRFTVAIDEVNKRMGITSGISKGVIFFSENLEILAGVMTSLAVVTIPLLVKGLQSLGIFAGLASAINPITLSLAVLAGSATYAAMEWDTFRIGLVRTKADLYDIAASIVSFTDTILINIAKLTGSDTSEMQRRSDESVKLLKDQARLANIIADIQQDNLKGAEKQADSAEKRIAKFLKNLENSLKTKEKKAKEILAELNQEYIKGKISVDDYFKSLDYANLYKVNQEFKNGKTDLLAYNAALSEISKRSINRMFNEGAISLQEFNQSIKDAELETLKQKVDAGHASMVEFNKSLAEAGRLDTLDSISMGITNYMESISNYSMSVIKATESVLKSAEDEFVNFLTTGEASWQNFANNIIQQLARITYQMLIAKPIIESVMGMLNPSGTAAAVDIGGRAGTAAAMPAFAKGGVFNNSGVTAFASGGVVNSPTAFGFGQGKIGIMGEAGSEAIMPLKRGRNGDLGVQATVAPVIVNINNNTDGQVTQTETTGPSGERILEVTIQNVVKRGMDNGAFDRSMRQNYSINRRGT